jgi:hypothetical protein
VSQLGILRVRQSVHAADSASARVSIQMACVPLMNDSRSPTIHPCPRTPRGRELSCRSAERRCRRADYVPEAVRFDAAFANTVLIAVARGVRAAMEASAIRTSSSAYSVKSWPSSSFQSLAIIVFMFVPFRECLESSELEPAAGNPRRSQRPFPCRTYYSPKIRSFH